MCCTASLAYRKPAPRGAHAHLCRFPVTKSAAASAGSSGEPSAIEPAECAASTSESTPLSRHNSASATWGLVAVPVQKQRHRIIMLVQLVYVK